MELLPRPRWTWENEGGTVDVVGGELAPGAARGILIVVRNPGTDEQTQLNLSAPAALSHLPLNVSVQRFMLTIVEGPAAGTSWSSRRDRCAIGSHPSNDVEVKDPTVSRFHCEVNLHSSGPRIIDLESRNGTMVDGVRVERSWLRDGSLLGLGRTVVRFHLAADNIPVQLSPHTEFGSLVGSSVPMRTLFSELELAANSDSTVLLEGETGTGKEEAALSIHENSGRRGRPFVIVDCGAIPANLLESELFGHERGAFTSAVTRRDGAFQAASGGTIFLDEIGELPLDLQPKVLRVIERRTVRRLGDSEQRPVNVRVVAATNRNLRREVNTGGFRSDLYFRLAVLKITLPPLRGHPEDIPLLVPHILVHLGVDAETRKLLTKAEFLAQLQRAAWPGNVRELRNYLERCVVLHRAPPLGESIGAVQQDLGSEQQELPPPYLDPRLSYAEARQLAVDDFEKRYLEGLLQHHGGIVSHAARAAGINRAYLYRLLDRHSIRR